MLDRACCAYPSNLIIKIKPLMKKSHWKKGVETYAQELIESLEGRDVTIENLLNGAKDWRQYSYGGCSLIYDHDICARLATPSCQKRKKHGELQPTSQETWLEWQWMALRQAARLVLSANRVK